MSDRASLAHARRIVVKLGTNVVTHDGVRLALGRLTALVEGMGRLSEEGRQIILVSSGSVAMGGQALGLNERPTSMGLRQACAAIGQSKLMAFYGQVFEQIGLQTAQVLVTDHDLLEPDRALCTRTTLTRLLELGAVPILNENDSVSIRELIDFRAAQGQETDETTFGDNDGLSARIALSLNADLLIILSDVDGLHSANPSTDSTATRIGSVDLIDDSMLVLTHGTSGTGTGGMTSKLKAAQVATEGGTAVLITSGRHSDVLQRALAGEDIGTYFSTQRGRGAKGRRILSQSPGGALVINEGAASAISDQKASLLPVGVTEVEGDFPRGAVVEIRDGSGRVLGRGLANYGSDACRKIMGRHSSEIAAVLGWRSYNAVMTPANMVLGKVS